MYSPYQQHVIGLNPNQFALYQQQQQFLSQHAQQVNLSNPPATGMPIQPPPLAPNTGLVPSSQVQHYQPSTQPKPQIVTKKSSKAIKIVDPNTGAEVKLDKAKTDNSPPPPVSSAPPTVQQGGLLPEPTTEPPKPDMAQHFKAKVQSTMNTSSPVFVPGQPLQPLVQEFRPIRVMLPPMTEFRPNAIIRRPDEVKSGEGEVPVINGDEKPKEKVDSVEPTTPLEPPPTELVAEETQIKGPPTLPVEDPTPGNTCNQCLIIMIIDVLKNVSFPYYVTHSSVG